jgi:hypothetical protein
MGYRKSADNITKTGKTDPKIYPDDGPTVMISGPKASKSALNKSMKAVGRNMARANNQRGR